MADLRPRWRRGALDGGGEPSAGELLQLQHPELKADILQLQQQIKQHSDTLHELKAGIDTLHELKADTQRWMTADLLQLQELQEQHQQQLQQQHQQLKEQQKQLQQQQHLLDALVNVQQQQQRLGLHQQMQLLDALVTK